MKYLLSHLKIFLGPEIPTLLAISGLTIQKEKLQVKVLLLNEDKLLFLPSFTKKHLLDAD